MNETPVKTILFIAHLPFGQAVWVERTSYGIIAAKADLHPDDPINTLMIGTVRECYHAVNSTVRALSNNRRGRVIFGKHAPLDWPQNVARRNQLLGV